MPSPGDDVIGLVSAHGMGDCAKEWDRMFTVRHLALDRYLLLEDDRVVFAQAVTDSHPESEGDKSAPAQLASTSVPTPALREAALSSRLSAHSAAPGGTPASRTAADRRGSVAQGVGSRQPSIARSVGGSGPTPSFSVKATTVVSGHSSIHSMTDWLNLDQNGQPRGA